MDVHNINQANAFTTKDGSEIRELLAHRNSCIKKQSLAEARLPPGGQTTPHYHKLTEEIYYILEGQGEMRLGALGNGQLRAGQSQDGQLRNDQLADRRDVGPGDAIAIPPGVVHTIINTGPATLKILCCCAPAYEHEDTVLLEDG